MARQTRAQRRARREARLEQAEQQAARPHGNGPQAEVQRRPAPEQRPQARHERRRVPFVGFVRESWGELHKVEWPTQNQLLQGTVVVLVACVIVGIYLWGADQVFRRLVEQVFLGQ